MLHSIYKRTMKSCHPILAGHPESQRFSKSKKNEYYVWTVYINWWEANRNYSRVRKRIQNLNVYRTMIIKVEHSRWHQRFHLPAFKKRITAEHNFWGKLVQKIVHKATTWFKFTELNHHNLLKKTIQSKRKA